MSTGTKRNGAPGTGAIPTSDHLKAKAESTSCTVVARPALCGGPVLVVTDDRPRRERRSRQPRGVGLPTALAISVDPPHCLRRTSIVRANCPVRGCVLGPATVLHHRVKELPPSGLVRRKGPCGHRYLVYVPRELYVGVVA